MNNEFATYQTLALRTAAPMDVQLADVAAMNIENLRKRYPNRYQHDLATFRADKQLEIQE